MEEKMKAIVAERYGSPQAVLELKDVPKPALGDDQVLVRVHASSVNPVEWYSVNGPSFVRVAGGGLRRPKDPALGADVAGVVEAVGKDVTSWEPGDEVFGMCGGAWAELAAVREGRLARKPAGASFAEVAAVPIAGLTALQALRDHGGVQPGQKVLINGASGGVGTFAVQVAKALGADVTAVCSTRNVELASSLGADRVVDYTRDDFTRLGVRHDVVIDVAGSRSLSALRRILTRDGIVVLVGAKMKARGLGPLPHIFGTLLASKLRSQTAKFFVATPAGEDMTAMAELIEAGKVRPVIDRTYELAQAADALAYLGEGHARGKIVLTV